MQTGWTEKNSLLNSRACLGADSRYVPVMDDPFTILSSKEIVQYKHRVLGVSVLPVGGAQWR